MSMTLPVSCATNITLSGRRGTLAGGKPLFQFLMLLHLLPSPFGLVLVLNNLHRF